MLRQGKNYDLPHLCNWLRGLSVDSGIILRSMWWSSTVDLGQKAEFLVRLKLASAGFFFVELTYDRRRSRVDIVAISSAAFSLV